MEISDSASVLLDGNASGKLEQESMRCRMPDARRCCTTTALLPASCVPAADARTSKAVGSLRRHPSVAHHHSLGGFLDGPQSVSAHPSRAMQGQRPPEKNGRGCQAVLTGRLLAQLGDLGGRSKRRPHLWDRRGFGALEPAAGTALTGKLDGLEWSASTVLLGEKKSVFPVFCAEISEPQSPTFMHSKGPVERLKITCSQTRRGFVLRLSPPPAASGTWHLLVHTPWLSPERRMPFLCALADHQYELGPIICPMATGDKAKLTWAFPTFRRGCEEAHRRSVSLTDERGRSVPPHRPVILRLLRHFLIGKASATPPLRKRLTPEAGT